MKAGAQYFISSKCEVVIIGLTLILLDLDNGRRAWFVAGVVKNTNDISNG